MTMKALRSWWSTAPIGAAAAAVIMALTATAGTAADQTSGAFAGKAVKGGTVTVSQ